MEQGLGQKSAKGVPKQHLLLPLCQFGAIEPGVASEYLISALAGKGNFVVLLNQAAEVEQRRIHIRHTRQVPGVHSIVPQLGQTLLAALQKGVIQLRVGGQHDFHMRPVPFRLESIGLEILIVTRRDVFLYREIQSKYQFPPR